jgi:hypothetical protein
MRPAWLLSVVALPASTAFVTPTASRPAGQIRTWSAGHLSVDHQFLFNILTGSGYRPVNISLVEKAGTTWQSPFFSGSFTAI